MGARRSQREMALRTLAEREVCARTEGKEDRDLRIPGNGKVSTSPNPHSHFPFPPFIVSIVSIVSSVYARTLPDTKDVDRRVSGVRDPELAQRELLA